MFPFGSQGFQDLDVEITYQWPVGGTADTTWSIGADTFMNFGTTFTNSYPRAAPNPAWEVTLDPYTGYWEGDSDTLTSPENTPSITVLNPVGSITYDWSIQTVGGSFALEAYKNNSLDVLDDTTALPFFRDLNFQHFAAYARQPAPGPGVPPPYTPVDPTAGVHDVWQVNLTDTGSGREALVQDLVVMYWNGAS